VGFPLTLSSIHCRVNAEHPELRFRVRLTEEAGKLELALV
jgi:hypothetical protein